MSDDFYETGGIGEPVPDSRAAEIASLRATIARLAMVVRAAAAERTQGRLVATKQVDIVSVRASGCDWNADLQSLRDAEREWRRLSGEVDAALSSLTAEDRRRAGIEG